MKTGRRLAVKVFFIFIAVMAVCTVLSRAADSVLVAQVKVQSAGRGRLSYIYEGTGNIVPKKEEKIFLWEGQQVEWTAARGSKVKKGECLVRFRKEYLEREIEKKQDELTQLELQKKEQQISARKPARVPAAEGAYQALSEAKKKLRRAESKEKKAKAAWEAYKKKLSNKKKEADKEAEGDKEKQETGGEGDTLKEQELKETYLAAKTETEAARQERSQAQAAYNLAKKEDAAQDKNNADAQEAAKASVQAVGEQVEAVRKELKILKGYKKAGGKILAGQDCMVLENSIQVGIITAGTEYISLGNSGWKLRGEIRKEDEDKIAKGLDVSVQFASGGKTETVIESVEMEAGKTDEGQEEEPGCFWYAALPEGSGAEESETFIWKTEAESEEEYEQVISLSALREDVEGAYCLIIEETEQMLGTQQAAKRVPVTVLEKDGTKAAITSELGKEDQIIVSSEKFVTGGDRVRIKE